jgi:hypothetical protein
MYKILPLVSLVFVFACTKTPTSDVQPITVDSATVTVYNGYGTAKYKVGDTVHIFSVAYSTSQQFDTWASLDLSLLNAKNEWHTWFIMPAKNVSFSGSLKSITPVTLQYEQIRGRDRLKPVYYYFPAGHKGIVYLLHGTGGTAQNLVNNYEFTQLYKDLVNDGFAIIVTEAEEATTGIDANGDGKLRWATTPVDTLNNVDYVNIRNITDTFYNRGVTSRSKPRYSIGMSNGGSFSSTLSYAYKFKTGVSYCAQMGSVLAQVTTIPFQFCMARFDNNDNVGPAGNAQALSDFNTMTGRGICSKYFIKERSPLYPERFARRGDITLAKSAAVFAELKSKGYINSKNYYVGYSSVLTAAYLANPASFPELSGLTGTQLLFVIEQIDLAVSDHQMYSDYNKATLQFLNQQCL